MKRLGWVRPAALALLLCSIGAVPEQQQFPLGYALAPVGPLGHWKFADGANPKTAIDSSGNGFNGTYSPGSALAEPAPGVKTPNTGSLKLDGAAGVITIPDNPALRLTGDFTISFWKKKTANVKDWSRVIGKGNGAQRNFGVWEAPEGDGKILFQMYGPGGQSVLDMWCPAPIAINTWAHILCTVSVNSVAMYIDGKLVGNAVRTGEPGTAPDPLTFGFAGYHTYWAGQLADIRIYNRSLSMSEVVYLAAGNGAPAAPTELAAAASNGNVELKWKASATPAPAGTITYYIVKRSKTAGSGYTSIGCCVPGTGFIDLKPEAGATCYYRVTAVNTGGESDASNEVTVAVPAK